MTPIAQPLPRTAYQDGHERLTVTGKRCPECRRVFGIASALRGHRQNMHGVPDPQIAIERKKSRDRERQRLKYLRERKAKNKTS